MNYIAKCSRKFGVLILLVTFSIALSFAPALWSDVYSPLHSPVVMLWGLIVLTLGGTGLAFYRGAFMLSATILKVPPMDATGETDKE